MPDELDSPALADPASLTAEERRLTDARAGVPWRAWGPYLSERQWGTVREDYSDSEDAWQPRCRVHARQIGVPVVCRLGSGLSLRAVGAG